MVLRFRTNESLKRSGRQNVVSNKQEKKKPREDFHKEFQVHNPDVKSMRDACGEKWKTMIYEEKVKFYDIATEKIPDFDRAMAEYIKRKESGEYEESEDNSEYDG